MSSGFIFTVLTSLSWVLWYASSFTYLRIQGGCHFSTHPWVPCLCQGGDGENAWKRDRAKDGGNQRLIPNLIDHQVTNAARREVNTRKVGLEIRGRSNNLKYCKMLVLELLPTRRHNPLFGEESGLSFWASTK